MTLGPDAMASIPKCPGIGQSLSLGATSQNAKAANIKGLKSASKLALTLRSPHISLRIYNSQAMLIFQLR